MSEAEIRHLLLYDYVDDMAAHRAPHRAAHLEKITAERDAGHLSAAGAFDPPAGAALVFTGVERDHVEAFVAADPYHQAGLITTYRIERWKLV
jgi:hypothetical protein